MKNMNKFLSLSLVTSLAIFYNNLYAIEDNALPQNPTIKSGIIQTSYDKNNLNVIQSSQKAIIDWNSFNIGQNASVNFQQPNSSASVLNRVTSSSASEIFGKLNANAEVFLINPNGVIFGKNSKVDVGSFIVSTMDIKDEDYLKSKYAFNSNNIFGKILNEGEISTKDRGFIAILAPEIINEGVIEAKLGNIVLASGEKVNLIFDDKELVSIEVSNSQMKSLIENKKMIITQDGKIFLSAKSKNEILGGIIKNSGIIEANSISSKNGEIYLDSSDSVFMSGELNSKDGTIKLDSKNIEISGKIDSGKGNIFIGNQEVEKTTIKSTASIKSNFVETSAKKLQIEDGVKIQAKEWLLDPTNITVASAGSESLSGIPATTSTSGDVTVSGSTINASLNNGTSVLLEATNDITINDNISKTAQTDATLTFKAGNNISIASSKSINSSSNKLNLVLWSDSDGSNVGGISLNSGVTINTNGGHLWMGGGSGLTTWNGLSVGSSYARGTGAATTAGIGINGSTIYTNGGNIKMYGYGPSLGGSGIKLANSIVSTQENSSSLVASGQIDLRGDGYYTSSANGFGLYFDNSSIIAGSSGVTIEGHQSVNNTGQWSAPLFMKSTTPTDPINIYASDNGSLNFNLYSNVAGSSTYNNFMQNDTSNVTIGKSGQNSNITITTYGASNSGLFLPNVITGGNLTIDITNSPAIGSGATAGWDTGSPWNTIDIAASQLIIDGNTSIIGNSAKSASVRFTNSNNNFGGTFSATNIKNLKLIDSSTLVLNAINTTGIIDIATLVGNLTINGNISTTNTTSSAIILNAGKNANVGTIAGGDIIYTSGIITTGTNGRATLYSGSQSQSVGLGSLTSAGSYINSDETTTLSGISSGIYFVYRDPATISAYLRLISGSSIYGDTPNFTYALYDAASGGNIITNANSSGTAIWSNVLTSSSNVGTYSIGYTSGITLGNAIYSLSAGNNSNWTIDARPLTLTADAKIKTYGDTNPNLTYAITSGSLVNSDTLSGSLSTAATQYSSVGNYDVTSTLANSNYNVTFVGTNKLTIGQKAITLMADGVSKTYGDANPNLTYQITSGSLVNNDTLSGSLATTATQYSSVGTYGITSTLSNTNYAITYVSDNLHPYYGVIKLINR